MDDYSDFPRRKDWDKKKAQKGCLTSRMSRILVSSIPFLLKKELLLAEYNCWKKGGRRDKMATESRENGFCTHVAKKGRAVDCCLDVSAITPLKKMVGGGGGGGGEGRKLTTRHFAENSEEENCRYGLLSLSRRLKEGKEALFSFNVSTTKF